jgi:methionyl-tRNA formyltransferase
MFDKLSEAGAKLLLEWLPHIAEGSVSRTPQKDSEATYAPNLSREDERLDWQQTSRELFNRVRGLNPMAGGFTYLDGEVFKVWGCRVPQGSDLMMRPEWTNLVPGSVLETGGFGIRVRTGDGSIVLTEVQPAGKKALAATEFVRGARLAPGKVLG